MSAKAMSLKGRIRNYAKQHNIPSQVVLQNYMFECFLSRLSISEYNQRFVIKGGVLVAAMVGLDTRSTMDLDATLRNLPLTEEKIAEIITAVYTLPNADDVDFQLVSIEAIRKDDNYGGYRVRIDAKYDTITVPLSVDVSTGDVITPHAIPYEFRGIFDDDHRFTVWGYNVETVMAEKVETILSRGLFNTRARDFYDVYILSTTQPYTMNVFKQALRATARHRGSMMALDLADTILQMLADSQDLKSLWSKYQQRFVYASNITYEDIFTEFKRLLDIKKNT